MSHLGTVKRPMTSARRDFIHGPLRSLDDPATVWDLLKRGMPGGIAMALLFAVATVAIIAFTGGIS